MKWKFWQRETRASDGYSDAIIQQLLSAASAADAPTAATGIEEASAGLWSRAFASAKVEPETVATAALTPTVLASIGRQLYEDGESLWDLEVSGGMLTLNQVSNYQIYGPYNRWEYEIDLPGPDAIITRWRPADMVLHLRYGQGRRTPWRGNSPLGRAASTRKLAANIDHRLSQEAGAPVGNLVPVPQVKQAFQDDLDAMAGGNISVQSQTHYRESGQSAARDQYQPKRLGLNPPETIDPLRRSASSHLANAGGIPAPLFAGERSDGASLRESWRQFLHGTILPVSLIIREELRYKLDEPTLTLNFDALMASDLAGRARAVGSLVQAGMPLEQAAAIAMLLGAE